MKRGLGIDVLTAARQRIARVFDEFDKVIVSFSAGKDSTVMLHLVMEEASRRDRRVGVLLVDLEAQYALTIEHALRCVDLYRDRIDLYWLALPIALRNAVSQLEPKWLAWDPNARGLWVREPPACAITDETAFPWFHRGMEFEELVPAFQSWYANGDLTAVLVGIRAQESLNRWRSVASDRKRTFSGLKWTTWNGGSVFSAYPIYDWTTEDIWRFHARYPALPYNRIYDRMHAAGLSLHQQRICQPYGDDQRRGLWLYHILEPETWGRVVARVAGANSGALYVQERGSIMGNHHVTKPEGHTWQTYAELLLSTMPPQHAEHYRAKIGVFLAWYARRGFAAGIPDEADPKQEAARTAPSWRRVCKMLLRNDYWAKGLSFTMHKSDAYEAYVRIQKARGTYYQRDFSHVRR